MDFDSSSQARSWKFDSSSLALCRHKALGEKPKSSAVTSVDRVRRFASGFHRSHEIIAPTDMLSRSSPITINEQELLVRFHSQQISQLVGPTAVVKGLVRNNTVLSTAIMLFRRFYLSNSVLDFAPRRIAVAAVYLASKVEEHRIELDLLERATAFIEQRHVSSSLGKQESYFVPKAEIETSERELMEGINYQMRCHHPHAAIRVLAREMSSFLVAQESEMEDETAASPRRVCDFEEEESQRRDLSDRAIAVAQNALVCSDVAFKFSPGPIAFAAVAIASRNGRVPSRNSKGTTLLEPVMEEFLRVRFPAEQEYDLRDFESQVIKIVHELDHCPIMDVDMLVLCQTEEPTGSDCVAKQMCEIRLVSSKVTSLRNSREEERERSQNGRYQSPRKRKEADEPLVGRVEITQAKIPKVTPTRLSGHVSA